MTKYVLLSDSTVDLPYEKMKEYGVPFVSLSFNIDDRSFPDDLGQSISYHSFYEQMRNEATPTTTQVNVAQYMNFFEPYVKEGVAIVYIAFSSGLSGSHNSALMAKADLLEQYPDAKITVIDSLCASMGEGLLIHYAVKARDEGMEMEDLVRYLEDLKLKVCHWFTVDDLNYLYRGGRVSRTAAFVGSMLSIKPVLNVDNEGHLIPRDKLHGRKKSLFALAKKVEQYIKKPDGQPIFISHGDVYDDANSLAMEIKKLLPTVGDILINEVGPVIGSHSGPGTVAVFFLGESRDV